MTELLFCILCIIALFVLSKAEGYDNKFLLLVGIGILSLTSGLRASDVGVDTFDYYNSIVTNFAWHPWQFNEEGFRVIVRCIMALFHDPIFVFLIIATVTNGLIICRLWDFRREASFSFMAFFYIAVFYIGTMNTMRQYLAVAIVFFATRFLERGKYLPFIVALLTSVSIHTTALMGLAYLFIYIWASAKGRKRVYIALISSLLLPVMGLAIAFYESGHIENYFSNVIENINITFIYRISIYIIACFLMWATARRDAAVGIGNGKARLEIPTISCFLGLAASSAGMFFAHLERLGYYFTMFEAVFWGKASRHKGWSWLFRLMPATYALYSFGYELVFNGSGIFPFHFFFN